MVFIRIARIIGSTFSNQYILLYMSVVHNATLWHIFISELENFFKKSTLKTFENWTFLLYYYKIFIFLEMKTSAFWPHSSKCFSKKKPALKKIIFYQKKAFLTFPKMEPCTFHANPQKTQISKYTSREIFYILGNEETEKNFLYFRRKRIFSQSASIFSFLHCNFFHQNHWKKILCRP